jgi:ubiquinone biosynthesis protein
MFRLQEFMRFIQIKKIILRYIVNKEVIPADSNLRWLVYLNPYNLMQRKKLSRGVAIGTALIKLGPIFVKFGQQLSIRADFVPADIVAELEKLQDKVPPFSAVQAKNIIEKSFNKSITEIFATFEMEPLASASISQVHAAVLPNGDQVIAKVLRPNIKKNIKRDIALLYLLASFIDRFWSQADRVRPKALVKEFENTILDELDLMREAANAQQLKRNFSDSQKMYVPRIYWNLVDTKVMVQERIYGVRIANVAELKQHNVNLKTLAEYGVDIFFTQVFRDSFFHADMHPGNLFVNISDPSKPFYIGVDFGIMGSLNEEDQRYLAENMLAFFNRDYRRVAKLHITSGWVAADTRLDQLESAIRTVSEPIFEKPLSEISFANVLLRLFQVAERFQMRVQPQLMLLQKTLFNIEGLGRMLYPDLDLWATAKPVLEKFVRQQRGVPALVKSIAQEFPDRLEQILQMPELVYKLLEKNTRHVQYGAKPAVVITASSKSMKFFALLITLLLIINLVALWWFL